MMKSKAYPSTNPFRIQWADKFTSIPGLLITSAIVSTLLGLHTTQWHSSESFAVYVRSNPARVAIVVQIVSHLLGLIQVQALCAMVRCSFVNSVNARTFSLHTMQWVQAASTPRLSFSLPWLLSLSLIGPVIISLIPAAIWSGSITPVIGVKNTTQSVFIPAYNSTNATILFGVPSDLLNTGGGSTSGLKVNSRGLFSFDPVALKGSIELSGAYASNTNITGNLHAKLDKTTYQYQGRSYGTGAAVGLLDLSINESLWYRYEEPTIVSEVTCIKNSSTGFNVYQETDQPILVYSTSGVDPTGENMMGGYYNMWLPHDFFAWGVSSNVTSNLSAYLYIRTGGKPGDDPWLLADFNATQCRVDFASRVFSVTVNTTSNLITADPEDSTDSEWPDHGNAILSEVLQWLSAFSTTDTGFGGSPLGRSLRVNVNQLTTSTKDDSVETILRGTEDYIGSLIDDTLVALASGRIAIWNSTTQVEAATGVMAATFGSWVYIIAMFAFNSLLCVLYLVEAARTQFWEKMSSFDVMNISAVIVGSLKGGVGLANDESSVASRQYTTRTNEGHSSAGEMLTDDMRMRIRKDNSVYPVLVPAADLDGASPATVLTFIGKSTHTSYTPASGDGTFASGAD